MSDPAIEAVERSLPYEYEADEVMADVAVRVAREALKPVREWHTKMAAAYALDDRPEGVLVEAVLQELAKLIYTTEELGNA
ncbi:hypothetical protein BI081_gp049 [Mycobacterium phage Tonenili]|uniref:Uncharacterized protein n=1 Tax=Mycobacterium phage Tonenili TaxID=1891703 RepID=A0A1C9EH24_9CAUD|nr:hypothetical protein BI081_gp049 [Mycobacterium phage Tonenili]AON96800.1 hypothetical protein SEA_TONENILI_49 [Mycobacterium phage Tonenili]